MKKLLFSVLCLALLLVSPGSRAEDVAYTDIDAENYIAARGITDRSEITRIHAWYTGLKALGLWNSAVHICSYRAGHNAASGTNMTTMVGSVGTVNGASARLTDSGLVVDGVVTNFVSFPNPLPNPVTNYTILVAFDSPRVVGTFSHLFGSYNETTTRGPSLWINGSPSAGTDGFGRFYHYNSSDGTGSTPPLASPASNPGMVGNRLWDTPQIIAGVFGPSTVRAYSGLDETNETTGGTYSAAWNGGTTFRVGVSLAGANSMVGNVAFTGVWQKTMTVTELAALRRLYSKTIGYGYMQRINAIFEGDSLTQGTCNPPDCPLPFSLVLQTNSSWGTLVASRNRGTSGHTSQDTLIQVPTQLYPLNVNFDYAVRQYYFLYAGVNDTDFIPVETSLSNLKSAWALAKAAGYRVVAFTSPNVQLEDANGNTAAERASRRRHLNRLIRESGGYDYLIELDKVPELQDQTNNTYYLGDEIHYTQAAHSLIAAKIMEKIPIP